MTRRQAMVKVLEDAGKRGCTRRELMAAGGCKWKHHLARIEEEYFVRKVRSRFGPETFRWILLAEQLAHGETCDVPAQVHLFEPDRLPRRAPAPHWSTAVAA